MDKLILIDGNSLLNRAFYATPVFTTKNGSPTNAIFGFIKLLLKILADNQPKYLVVAFDMKAPTFRHKMFDGYKATRKGMPEELAAQVQPLKSLLAAMKIKTYEQEGIEADDILGTLSNRFDVHSYIFTGDHDCYQLVDDRTDVFFTKRGVTDLIKLNVDNFYQTVGLEPKQIIDLKALMGDHSDNIPGVNKIGEKTATDLISKFHSLDGVYQNLHQLKGAVLKNLTEGKDMAYLSYQLATINRNCDIDVRLDDCIAPYRYGEETRQLFEEFEFKSLLTMDIFEEGVATIKQISYPELVSYDNYEQVISFIEQADELSFAFHDNQIQLYDGKKIVEIGVGQTLLTGITSVEFAQILQQIFEDKNQRVIVYDCKSLMHVLRDYGVEILCSYDDISVMQYLTDFGTENTSKALCEQKQYEYQYETFALWEICKQYHKNLIDNNLLDLYQKIELPLISVLYQMELVGVNVSLEELDACGKRFEQILTELKQTIFNICGIEFNINSPAQLGEVLFDKLGLKSGKKNKNGKYSTNAEILETLAQEHEVVRHIIKYRQFMKLYSTYVEGFKPLIDKNGKIHTTYNQTVTATGRLSSANPNMQNIPIRENEGRELRKLFLPSKGCVLIDADYSQIELRLLAHFSGCKKLIEAYNNGEDVHAYTASQVFGVPISEVTQKMRRDAKAVNFGIIYGISEFGLSKNINVSVATAREYIKKYFERYDEVENYMNQNVAFAKENGFVQTLTGRKRTIPELKSANYMVRQFGERAAMNMPLQGTSADIIKIAMVNVSNALNDGGFKAKLILQVHDELVIDCPKEEADEVSKLLKKEMENAVQLSVPLTVDVHIGNNWYEAK